MPDVLKSEFKKLKDEMYDYKEQDDNSDFIKLLQIKDVSDDLKETLILLHSNYTTEIREIRNHYCRLFNKLVDRDIEMLELILKMLDNGGIPTNKQTNNDSAGGKFSTIRKAGGYLEQLPKMWLYIVIIIVSMSILHHFIPESFERAVKLFKNVFTLGMFSSPIQVNDQNYQHNNGHPYYYIPGTVHTPIENNKDNQTENKQWVLKI